MIWSIKKCLESTGGRLRQAGCAVGQRARRAKHSGSGQPWRHHEEPGSCRRTPVAAKRVWRIDEDERHSVGLVAGRVQRRVRGPEFRACKQVRRMFLRAMQQRVQLGRHRLRRERRVARLAPAETRAVVAADAGYFRDVRLHPRPRRRHRRRGRFQDHRGRAVPFAIDVQLMSANIHQPSGMGELPAFERGRDALIRGSCERDKEDDGAAGEKGATQGRRHDAEPTIPSRRVRTFRCANRAAHA